MSELNQSAPRRKRFNHLMTAALLASTLAPGMAGPAAKPKRKCRLQGCNEMTSHNGGYCCAEHHAKARTLGLMEDKQ